MKRSNSDSEAVKPTTSTTSENPDQTSMAHEKSQKRVGKRPGRKPSKIDQRAKLERSRQSARECRARKKLRYQYLEELVSSREKAVFSLRDELQMYKRWCCDLDVGILPDGLFKVLAQEEKTQSTATVSPPQSIYSTPTASPLSVEDEGGAGYQQYRGHTGQVGEPWASQQQPWSLPHATPAHQLTSMHRGSRSFEEASGCSTLSSVSRAGSVPNLASRASSAVTTDTSQHLEQELDATLARMRAGHTHNLLFTDCDSVSSAGFSPMIGSVVSDIHRSSPTASSSAAVSSWLWESEATDSAVPNAFPYTSANNTAVTGTPSFTTSGAAALNLRTGGCVNPGVRVASSTVTSGSYTDDCVTPDPSMPYQQRPRSCSDSARRVTSSTVTSTPSANPPTTVSVLLTPTITTATAYVSQGGVCSRSVINPPRVPATSTRACVSSTDLTASISQPIPHWYSFLDDLECTTTMTSRQGAFSDAGTSSSSGSRGRSGPATPSSVGSPYAHSQQQQQQQQQSGSHGNIPNIISDLIAKSQSS
ncbi:uncharacterized protein [Littorina saxatilis]|uniref:BZIP domain-containing protein n=1 Tax=Littorina saxatilis TaxID=31220 RepID=A0AAN9G1U1_9CAEN